MGSKVNEGREGRPGMKKSLKKEDLLMIPAVKDLIQTLFFQKYPKGFF